MTGSGVQGFHAMYIHVRAISTHPIYNAYPSLSWYRLQQFYYILDNMMDANREWEPNNNPAIIFIARITYCEYIFSMAFVMWVMYCYCRPVVLLLPLATNCHSDQTLDPWGFSVHHYPSCPPSSTINIVNELNYSLSCQFHSRPTSDYCNDILCIAVKIIIS